MSSQFSLSIMIIQPLPNTRVQDDLGYVIAQFSMMYFLNGLRKKVASSKGQIEINYKVVLYAQAHFSHIYILTYHRCNLYHPLLNGHQIPKVITDYEDYLLISVNGTVLTCHVVVATEHHHDSDVVGGTSAIVSSNATMIAVF